MRPIISPSTLTLQSHFCRARLYKWTPSSHFIPKRFHSERLILQFRFHKQYMPNKASRYDSVEARLTYFNSISDPSLLTGSYHLSLKQRDSINFLQDLLNLFLPLPYHPQLLLDASVGRHRLPAPRLGQFRCVRGVEVLLNVKLAFVNIAGININYSWAIVSNVILC